MSGKSVSNSSTVSSQLTSIIHENEEEELDDDISDFQIVTSDLITALENDNLQINIEKCNAETDNILPNFVVELGESSVTGKISVFSCSLTLSEEPCCSKDTVRFATKEANAIFLVLGSTPSLTRYDHAKDAFK